MNRYRLVLAIVLLAAAATIWLSGAATARQESKAPKAGAAAQTEVAKLMRRKLENAQKLLEGIALADFDKIDKAAGELMLVSQAAEWKIVKTADYELHSNEFRRLLKDMGRNAKAKNLDAVTLNYVDMTLTCVKCHKHVRETKITLGPPWDKSRFAAE